MISESDDLSKCDLENVVQVPGCIIFAVFVVRWINVDKFRGILYDF